MVSQVVPRIHIEVIDGIATVVDGAVHVVIVDFDREVSDPMSDGEIAAEFEGGVESGSADSYESLVAAGKEVFTRSFSIKAAGPAFGR